MNKRFLMVLSLLLVCMMVSSHVFAATETTTSAAQVSKKDELVSISIGDKCFVFPKDADPDLVVSEINRILGKDTITSLDHYTNPDMVISAESSAIKALLPYCTIAGGIYALTDIVIQTQRGAGVIYILYNGIMQALFSGTGYVPGEYYYLYPLFEVVDGLVNWY